jgi:NitT/TauT family transport system ATP-binding protein
MSRPVIVLEHASKIYGGAGGRGDEKGHLAVANFSLAVEPGEFVSIVGPSGCGKSTVLFMLAGLRPPTAGRIELCGRRPEEAVRAGRATVIFQQPVLFEWLSVEENVLLPLRMRDPHWWLWRTRRRRYLEHARQALATVELDGFGHFYPGALSGGMQQRAALARALTLAPEVLLLDEPFGALDEITRERMNRELLRLFEGRGLTVVFVTHSIEEAVFLSDRVVVMSRGPSVLTGTSIVRVVVVRLPRPRDVAVKEEVAFFETVREGREALRQA